MKKPRWLDDVAPHDFDAALAYLTLKLDPSRAEAAVAGLRAATLEWRRANDIIRACGLEPLPDTDPGVAKNLRKIRAGKPLSPVLLVSYHFGGDIADGYHRVSTVYLIDPFALVPLRVTNVREAR